MPEKEFDHYIIVKGYVHKLPLSNTFEPNENKNDIKQCSDCGMDISFQEFCRNNPSLTTKKALELWEDPIFSLYCPDCFFNRPEKPFKVKRRFFNYL